LGRMPPERKGCFNPRSRTGSDRTFAQNVVRNLLFQSTLPHGERQHHPQSLAQQGFAGSKVRTCQKALHLPGPIGGKTLKSLAAPEVRTSRGFHVSLGFALLGQVQSFFAYPQYSCLELRIQVNASQSFPYPAPCCFFSSVPRWYCSTSLSRRPMW
jgi:hypothetical protein